MMFRPCALWALLALMAHWSSATPHRKSDAMAASWSKKTVLAPMPDSDLVPFVTSRVERVPKPEEAPVDHRRRPSKVRAPSAGNAIDDDIPKVPKVPKQANRRRWGPEAYNLFADAEALSPFSVPRKPTKYIRKAQLPYQRTPFDATGSVTSSTISVAPLRYKIIDMGDPWVTWSHAQGFNPHERQRPREETPLGIYGGGGWHYGGAVIDPFRREQHADAVVPWSVQVGTSLTVNDDGRRSRRQFYVQSQRRPGDDLLG